MRTLAIGDIHGCNVALTSLIRDVQPTSEDQLIFLGDYLDRGPASRDVLETLLQIRKEYRTVFLRGNHEVMILEGRQDTLKANLWQSYGGLDTLVSYGAAYQDDWPDHIATTHWDFLNCSQRF